MYSGKIVFAQVMAFAQLSHRESLRDTEICLRAMQPKLYHMGIRSSISRNNLANANEVRDWRIYADFAQILIHHARQLYADEDFGRELASSCPRPRLRRNRRLTCRCPHALGHFGKFKNHFPRDVAGSIIALVMNKIRKTWGQARGPVAMFLTLFAFWLLISGAVDFQHLIAGALSAALVTWYWRHLVRGLVLRRDVLPYRVILNPKALPFLIFMLAQIFKSNIAVAMVVLNPRLPISPVVVTTRTGLKRNLTRVMLAQSITLTPGTVTLDLKRDHLVIHSLTESASDFSHLDAIEMIGDAIEALANKPGFQVDVFPGSGEYFEVGSADQSTLTSLLLRRARQLSGLSLAQVARRLGSTSVNAYARYEQGRSTPSVQKLTELFGAVSPGRDLVLVPSEA